MEEIVRYFLKFTVSNPDYLIQRLILISDPEVQTEIHLIPEYFEVVDMAVVILKL
jgi:hypothetical protein